MIAGNPLERSGHYRRRRVWMLAGITVAMLVATLLAGLFLSSGRARTTLELQNGHVNGTGQIGSSVTLRLPPPDLLRPLTPEEAVEENAKRTFAERPDSPAKAFRLSADPESRERALECLTQAVYYEAAGEGAEGGRAVAQVVLNRMRHPAYPSSVCGVIYEGSERTTGCQFTFTCDGSLARIPARYLWAQAKRIAAEALAGGVYGPIGHSTHYHADYVLPYWADSLDKSRQIGRHIFYRLKGSLGSAGVFRMRYAGREPLPPSPSTTEVSLEAMNLADEQVPGATAELAATGLTAPTGELLALAAPAPKPALLADIRSGTLILDRGKAPPAKSAERQTEGCAAPPGDKQLRPMEVQDMRPQAPAQTC